MADLNLIREALKAASRFLTHREDSFEVCCAWCPLCKVDAAIATLAQPAEIAELKAEYLDKQLWKFISIDEWLEANKRPATPEPADKPGTSEAADDPMASLEAFLSNKTQDNMVGQIAVNADGETVVVLLSNDKEYFGSGKSALAAIAAALGKAGA